MEPAINVLIAQFKTFAGKDGSSNTLSKEEFQSLVASQLTTLVKVSDSIPPLLSSVHSSHPFPSPQFLSSVSCTTSYGLASICSSNPQFSRIFPPSSSSAFQSLSYHFICCIISLFSSILYFLSDFLIFHPFTFYIFCSFYDLQCFLILCCRCFGCLLLNISSVSVNEGGILT